jgi:hypothetical protein
MYIALRQALDKLNREWPRLEYLHFSRKALSYLERSILMKNVDIFWNPKQMDKRDSPDIQISTETGHVILVAELLHHSKKNEKGYLSEIKRKLKKLRRTGAKRVMLFFRAENYDAEVGKFLQQETEVDVVKLDLSEE